MVTSKALSDRQRRIYDFLQQNPVGILSTTDTDKNPHGTVVYYTTDDNFIIRILAKTGTHTYDNLTHNNHIALTVFQPHTQTTAQLHGTATEQPGTDRISAVFGAIFGASPRPATIILPPTTSLQASAFTTFQINPGQIHIATYARADTGAYSDLFESIESFDFKADS